MKRRLFIILVFFAGTFRVYKLILPWKLTPYDVCHLIVVAWPGRELAILTYTLGKTQRYTVLVLMLKNHNSAHRSGLQD